jgi:TonB family protein
MRRILIASLFVSTVLLHAQTATKGQGATLEASNSAPTALATPASASDADATITMRRVSSGAIQPHLLSTPVANVTRADFNSFDPSTQQMMVYVQLNAKGVPQSVQVVKAVNPTVDRRILEAVSRYHFSPGMVDNVPVASDLYLKINFNVQ